MKAITLSLVTAASLFAASASIAAPVSCEAMEQRIARSANEFVRISTGDTAPSTAKRALPSQLYQATKSKRIQQQHAADQLWDLRTEMSNKQCAQAARFMY